MGKTLTEKYQGNIPLDTKYHVHDIAIKDKDDTFGFSTCENCGHIISNIFIIKGENEKTYGVGSECVIPLTNNGLELQEWKRLLARKKKFIKYIATEAKTVIWSDKHDTAWAYSVDVNSWQHYFRYRFSRKEYQDLIKLKNIKTIVDNRD